MRPPRRDALRAMHEGFLAADGSAGAHANVAPVAAMIADWTPTQRTLVVCGNEDFSAQDLARCFRPAAELAAAALHTLHEAICEHLTMQECRDLLQWVTGLRALPCNSDDSTVTVHHVPTGFLPSVATCTLELRIPADLAAVQLAEKLRVAMKEGGGFGER